jgi:hypothetical protein
LPSINYTAFAFHRPLCQAIICAGSQNQSAPANHGSFRTTRNDALANAYIWLQYDHFGCNWNQLHLSLFWTDGCNWNGVIASGNHLMWRYNRFFYYNEQENILPPIHGCKNKHCNEQICLMQPTLCCKIKFCNEQNSLMQPILGCKNKYYND